MDGQVHAEGAAAGRQLGAQPAGGLRGARCGLAQGAFRNPIFARKHSHSTGSVCITCGVAACPMEQCRSRHSTAARDGILA